MNSYLTAPRRWSSYAVFPTTSEADLERALSAALDWAYDGIQIDLTKAHSPNRDLVVREILAADLLNEARVAVLFRVAASEAEEFLAKDSQASLYWNIVLHLPMEEALVPKIIEQLARSEKYVLTLRFLPGSSLERGSQILNDLKAGGVRSVHLEFPFESSNSWQEREVVKWVTTLHRESDIKLLPPIGWGLGDPDLSADDQILPTPEIILRQNVESSPKLSVVIPTFERIIELANTVRHLLKQKLSFGEFEIIIVDCGSHDTTLRDLETLISSEGRTTQTTVIKIARPIRRRRGESRYRAGLARNVGAARARGEFLLFLDDDVLLPNDYLGQVLQRLESDPERVLVGRCHVLKPEHFGVRMGYERFRVERDTEHPDRGFWRDFYARGIDWMKLRRPWRFIATHSLALSRELFVRTGWFRENFISYGFEDMELGFKLSKLGAQFELLPIPVFRQTQIAVRESGMARKAKHLILSRAAQVFYRHTLSEDVFIQVRSLFRRPLWFWLWYDRVKTGGPLWRYRRRSF